MNTLGRVHREFDGRYMALPPGGMEDGWIAIQSEQNIENDFDPEEMDVVKSMIHDPVFWLVEGRDEEICYSDNFVLALDNPELFVIDNDHGIIARASEIKKMIQKNTERWLYAKSLR